MIEIPEAEKCCFCLPLRRGLLAWVYIKLVILLCVLLVVVIPLTLMFSDYLHGMLLALLLVIIVYGLLSLEIIFAIIFIISAHRKNHQYLRLYYQYEVVMLSTELILAVAYIWFGILDVVNNETLGLVLGGLCIIIVFLALHAYFIYLVRSEVRKLEMLAQFHFKNLTSDDSTCTAQILD